MRPAAVWAFVRLGRPKFLVGGFVLYALGAAIARATGHPIDASRYALGQAAVTAFQLMTHYANDYFDYDADRANATPTAWSGGSRVLVDGVLSREVAYRAAVTFAVLGFVLVLAIGWAEPAAARGAVPLLTATAALAWAYSAPPLRLCARGAGELDTAIVVTALVPLVAFAMQAPDLHGVRVVLLAIAPLVLLQFAMLLAIGLPDETGDAATGKRTLVVRLGPARATRLQIAAVAAAFLVLPLLGWAGLPWRVAAAAALVAPVAGWQVWRLATGYADPARWESLSFWSTVLLSGTALAELAAFATLR